MSYVYWIYLTPSNVEIIENNLVTNYMSVYDIGRLCIKTMGREAGHYCVIVDVIDKNYLLIDGLKIRRRRANYKHLEPIAETINIKKGAKHEEVEAAIKTAKLEKKMKELIPITIK
jgi:large subunit ribosomal protein L14e